MKYLTGSAGTTMTRHSRDLPIRFDSFFTRSDLVLLHLQPSNHLIEEVVCEQWQIKVNVSAFDFFTWMRGKNITVDVGVAKI